MCGVNIFLAGGERSGGAQSLKCSQCDLVTFDHLPQCPSCNASFRLKRGPTRKHRDPSRPIYLPPAPPPKTDASVELTNPRADEGYRRAAAPRLPNAHTGPSVIRATTLVEPSAVEPWFEPRTVAPPVEPSVVAPWFEPRAVASWFEPSNVVPPVEPRVVAPSAAPFELELTPPANLSEVLAPTTATTIPENDAHDNDHPSLGELAAVERRQGLGASTNHQTVASTPVPSAPTDAAAPDPHRRDADALRGRMMRAGRARRKRRPDLASETVDPALPGWHEPGIENPVAEPVTTGSTPTRRRA